MKEFTIQKLSEFYDLSNIDWDLCYFNSSRNVELEIWEFARDNPSYSNRYLSEKFNIPFGTICDYIRRARLAGFIDDNRSLHNKIGSQIATDAKFDKSKPIFVYYGSCADYIGEFKCINHLSKYSEELFGIHFDRNTISNSLHNNVYVKDFLFSYCTPHELKIIGLPKIERREIPVVQIDKETHKILRIWASGTIASNYYNLAEQGISACCVTYEKGKKNPIYSVGGYIWMYKKEGMRTGDIVDVPKHKNPHLKPVAQINKDTNKIIAIFESIKEAKEMTGFTSIRSAATGRCHTAGGFKWGYATIDMRIGDIYIPKEIKDNASVE